MDCERRRRSLAVVVVAVVVVVVVVVVAAAASAAAFGVPPTLARLNYILLLREKWRRPAELFVGCV